jgi:hypothetical protein
MIQFNDNPILVDVNSKRSRKEKILCMLCFPKIQLDCINPDENRYRCPRCKNTYQLGYEILPQEDILESSHSEQEEEDAGLLFAEDEFKSDNNNESKSDIKIPRYMKDAETTTVTYFKEE